MAKENPTLALYRANRERGRKVADAALTKAVAAVTKKAAGGKTVKPTVEELPPAGDKKPVIVDSAITTDAANMLYGENYGIDWVYADEKSAPAGDPAK